MRQSGIQGLRYPSVKLEGGLCFGLFSPKTVKRVVQAKHYEMVYREGALQVNQLLQPR
ncbi:RES family NAD+ phosphorylase [Salinimonas sediminis]|uniref:RES family NAD+ phosphorylase n=1 Tax=Salinimonas sediminis TaxID=2303538 RepID=UPI001E2B7C18|nr:RES family NAD+ phosphorylase [Salinimonas sediminis]